MTLMRWTSLLVSTNLLFSLGCGSSSEGSGGSTGVFEPSGFSCSGAMPSLSNDIVPNITTPSCSGVEGCHLAMHSTSGVIDMMVDRATDQCSDGRLLVKPGDPEHSYVIHKLTDHNICGSTLSMPEKRSPLPKEQIQAIYDWICIGAPDN